MQATNQTREPLSPEERIKRRRVRRWKRRGRIAAPFLGIALLLAALTLSVDLITYQKVKPERVQMQNSTSPTNSYQPIRSSIAAASVVDVQPTLSQSGIDGIDLSLSPTTQQVPTREPRRFATPSPYAPTPTR